MFSADITWAPIVESKTSRKGLDSVTIASQPSTNSDARSVRSDQKAGGSMLTRRFRWPGTKSPKRIKDGAYKDTSGRNSIIEPAFSKEADLTSGAGLHAVRDSLVQPVAALSNSLVRAKDGLHSTLQDDLAPFANEVHELPTTKIDTARYPTNPINPGHYRTSPTSSLSGSTRYTQITRSPRLGPGNGIVGSPPHSVKSVPVSASSPVEEWARNSHTYDSLSLRSFSVRTAASQAGSDSLRRASSKIVVSMPTQEEMHLQQPKAQLVDSFLKGLICRMNRASKKTMLSRLEETWDEALDLTQRTDIDLEKSLWILTVLQFGLYKDLSSPIPNPNTMLDHGSVSEPLSISSLRKALGRSGRNLELACNNVEVLQLSCLNPDGKFTYVVPTTYASNLVLPTNTTLISVYGTEGTQIPLSDRSIDYVHATSLASTFPAAKLKTLLQECERVVIPGGTIELRLLDPVPAASGTLLREWLDKNLLLNLEKEFRCLRPLLLVPIWVKEAGFHILDDVSAQTPALSLPAVTGSAEETMEKKLGPQIGRWLWQDTWGRFVVPNEGDGAIKMWWEIEDILKECLERSTTIEVKMLYAVKPVS